MKKQVFEVLHEMNVEDGINKTALVGVCTTVIRADKVKQGAAIVMGAPQEALFDIASGKTMPILLLVNKDEYFRRIKEEKP